MTTPIEKFYAESAARDAVMAARAEVVKAEFKAEFAAMMKKYKVEITVREGYSGYSTYADGIDFEFDGVYGDDPEAYAYFEIRAGTSIIDGEI